jgi:hypothetical protein
MQLLLTMKFPSAYHYFVLYYIQIDHLCGLVVRVPSYITKMYCVSCEVRTEFIYVM